MQALTRFVSGVARASVVLPLALSTTTALSAQVWEDRELSAEQQARLRAQLSPPAADLQWREIPWRASFWEAVDEAARADKPILLWAMNGHPLGHT